MGSTQKYSLKWNDFTVNVASTFRDLHSRHDFVDVTLACADGSTLEAHKVILSSVSSYFRDILKTTPCKHPIIILKDTGRDEASAMLEFAYTGEVNVAQELLPSLLHTARSFRIKGLDKVENPVEPAPRVSPGPLSYPVRAPSLQPEAQTPSSEHWMESAPPTRSHTPSSIHSQHDVKPPHFSSEHFLSMSNDKSHPGATQQVGPAMAHSSSTNNGFSGLLRSAEREREREIQNHQLASPPPSLPNSQPPTREASPAPMMLGQNARTPPPKRWKRSFDMAHPNAPKPPRDTSRDNGVHHEQPLSLIAERCQGEDYSQNRPSDYDSAKRFCEPNAVRAVTSSTSNGVNGASSVQRTLPYPHSMPTSPTMFERGNEARLAGLIRQHLANDNGIRATSTERYVNGGGSHSIKTTVNPENEHTSPTTNGNDLEPMDYRCVAQTKLQQHQVEQGEYNGRVAVTNRHGEEDDESNDRFSRGRPGSFRPESAPTVLNMSPECSLSGPPSVRAGEASNSEEYHGHMMHNGEEISGTYDESVAKAFSIAPDGMGRYTCDECGKIFKHPGSLQHHRHIHRGTHRCPSCGKAFSRRWDMERHLNKSKYGCPANRFSIGSTGSNNSNTSIGSGSPVAVALTAAGVAVSGGGTSVTLQAAQNGHSNGASCVPPSPSGEPRDGPAMTVARQHVELLVSTNGGVGVPHAGHPPPSAHNSAA